MKIQITHCNSVKKLKNVINLEIRKNMNNNLICFLLFYLIAFIPNAYGQKQTKKWINVYTLNPKISFHDTVIMPIGNTKQVLKAGWTITEIKNGFTIQRVLEKDSVIVSKKDSAVKINQIWKIEHVKHTANEPDRVYLNPVAFSKNSNVDFNTIAYIPLPVGEKVVLTHLHTKWSAITIPFSIRPAIRGRLNSQVTSEFKIGTAFSLNHDWEVFKNKRMDVKKNTYGFSVGIGFGLGRIPLNNNTTRLSNTSYDLEEEGLVFFLTPGVGINIRGFKVLVFYGWDLGLTYNTKDWDYNRRPYIGIGLGFDFWTRKI